MKHGECRRLDDIGAYLALEFQTRFHAGPLYKVSRFYGAPGTEGESCMWFKARNKCFVRSFTSVDNFVQNIRSQSHNLAALESVVR